MDIALKILYSFGAVFGLIYYLSLVLNTAQDTYKSIKAKEGFVTALHFVLLSVVLGAGFFVVSLVVKILQAVVV